MSVGEVNLIAPVISKLRERCPDHRIVISSTSRTGFELAHRKFPTDIVTYAPLDFSWATREAVRRIRPELLVLAELELWPNLIDAAKRAGARVAIVNGRLSEKSYAGYRRIRPLIRSTFRQIDGLTVQNTEYAARFEALGVVATRMEVTGNVKFDGAECDRHNPATARLALEAGLADGDLVFVAGSTQAPEEQMALEAFRQFAARYPRLKLLIVPRHPERFAAVAEILRNSPVDWARRSEFSATHHVPSRVWLIDTIGELSAWWGRADLAFVGGSFGRRGGQNMIEPSAYGAAVSFGPNTKNFSDVTRLLLAAEAAVVVRDQEELNQFVGRCLADEDWRLQLGNRAQTVVQQQLGVLTRTTDALEELISPRSPGPRLDPRHGLLGSLAAEQYRPPRALANDCAATALVARRVACRRESVRVIAIDLSIALQLISITSDTMDV